MKVGAFTIFFFTIGLIIFGVLIYAGWSDDESKKIDCFDNHNNKILNQVCLDEPITENEKFAVLMFGFVLMVLFTFVGLMLEK